MPTNEHRPSDELVADLRHTDLPIFEAYRVMSKAADEIDRLWAALDATHLMLSRAEFVNAINYVAGMTGTNVLTTQAACFRVPPSLDRSMDMSSKPFGDRGDEHYKPIDGDVLVNANKDSEGFLIVAQTLNGAAYTARALRESGWEVTIRKWRQNGGYEAVSF